MTTREEVSNVYELAKDVLDARESLYGDYWKRVGFDNCFAQIERKATYLKVQKENGHANSPKFKEDLLDLMNWCAFAYKHLELGARDEG